MLTASRSDVHLDGTPRQRLRSGVWSGLSLASASFALAVTFGATARTLGWDPLPTIVCSLVVFSGSAQFALVTALAGGGGTLPAVAAAALINARFIPMSVAIGPSLRGGPLRRALVGQAVVDGSWVVAHLGRGRFDLERMVGATLPQWPAWVTGTAIGVFLHPSPEVVDRFGLDVVFPAFFLLLLLEELRRSAAARRAAALAAVLAGVLVVWVPPGVALLGASVAALLGLLGSGGDPAEHTASAEHTPSAERDSKDAPGDTSDDTTEGRS
ncbi:AzlC family ABC transporter permease [Actinomadura graeca]|uniref:AzlC family ABC transporter permease n=1 Tax=Actinomadura graeca TaxID=2750812 RepID=A0ABX8QW40_9ACTN|nr:AzlC family ABC transporter permease [Actinomadura graeca]QXJ22399.1 AzlC family ABC transporter permease [Actinomadura graeca]